VLPFYGIRQRSNTPNTHIKKNESGEIGRKGGTGMVMFEKHSRPSISFEKVCV
jgi:hypothetical protein